MLLCEFLYADDFVLMSETMRRLTNKFLKSKSQKVIHGKTEVIDSGVS